MMPLWPWWLGALGLASAAFLHLWLVRRPLGVSGLVNRALAGTSDVVVGDTAAAPPLGFAPSVIFLVGTVLGGLVFGVVQHGGIELAPAGVYVRLFGAHGAYAALFLGGVLVGVGTSMAGGCTSGHGLVGCGRLQPPSIVATACFFGIAIVLGLGVRALVLPGMP